MAKLIKVKIWSPSLTFRIEYLNLIFFERIYGGKEKASGSEELHDVVHLEEHLAHKSDVYSTGQRRTIVETLDAFMLRAEALLTDTSRAICHGDEMEETPPQVTVRAGTSIEIFRHLKRLSGDELKFTRAEIEEGVSMASVAQSSHASTTRIMQITNGLSKTIRLGGSTVRPGGVGQVYESELAQKRLLEIVP